MAPCRIFLLGKDGVLIPQAPRLLQSVPPSGQGGMVSDLIMAPANRVDVLVRCEAAGTYALVSGAGPWNTHAGGHTCHAACPWPLPLPLPCLCCLPPALAHAPSAFCLLPAPNANVPPSPTPAAAPTAGLPCMAHHISWTHISHVTQPKPLSQHMPAAPLPPRSHAESMAPPALTHACCSPPTHMQNARPLTASYLVTCQTGRASPLSRPTTFTVASATAHPSWLC